MKGEKLRALIKFSFPTKLFICSLDQEIKMRYSDALIEELNELERLSEIGVTSNERPCMIRDKKAIFHCWSKDLRAMNITIGIVEYEDGSVHECYPSEIKFIDKVQSEGE